MELSSDHHILPLEQAATVGDHLYATLRVGQSIDTENNQWSAGAGDGRAESGD